MGPPVSKKYIIKDSDNFHDLFIAGHCVNHPGYNFRFLETPSLSVIPFVLDGRNKVVIMQDKSDGIMGAVFIRLLLNKELTAPIMYIDGIYPLIMPNNALQIMLRFCKTRSMEIGAEIYFRKHLSTIKINSKDEELVALDNSLNMPDWISSNIGTGTTKSGSYTIPAARRVILD